MSAYLPVLVRRKQRWEQAYREGEDKNGRLKRFVRKGIPAGNRADVWTSVSGAGAMRDADPVRFCNMLLPATTTTESSNANAATFEQIDTDLNRTFPTNVYFSEKEDPKCLVRPLRNVLYAFANDNPMIGYCQGMNYVAALLLIVTRDEERSFWLLKALTERLLPDYYTPGIPGLLTDVEVFAELLR